MTFQATGNKPYILPPEDFGKNHDVRREQKAKKNLNIGYNVISEKLVDMVKDGVIDPAKVTRGALENAASIAAMILTTEALITDVPEESAPPAPPMPEY